MTFEIARCQATSKNYFSKTSQQYQENSTDSYVLKHGLSDEPSLVSKITGEVRPFPGNASVSKIFACGFDSSPVIDVLLIFAE